MLVAIIAALLWANSRWREGYFEFWQTIVAFEVGGVEVSKPLLLWINDGFMAIFFFVIGLEIKREVFAGELANPRNALLPLIAAIGGMVVPSLAYAAVIGLADGGAEALRGWAIPAATDIAFSLGVLTLLGKQVPVSAKVFLTTFAIADDVGATLIIALYYSGELNLGVLGLGFSVIAAMLVGNRLGVRSTPFYASLSLVTWGAFLQSGVHPTTAGFLCAFAIPSFRRIEPIRFVEQVRSVLDDLEHTVAHINPAYHRRATQEQQSLFASIERSAQAVQTPLQKLEARVHPGVAFAILPLFALANAGVELPGSTEAIKALLCQPVTLAVLAGLVVGKPLGIYSAVSLAVWTGLFQRPNKLDKKHMLGLSFLGGVGFTMSIFIASAAFGSGHGAAQGLGHIDAAVSMMGQAYSHHEGSPGELSAAKLAVLLGSLLSGSIGFLLLKQPRRERLS